MRTARLRLARGPLPRRRSGHAITGPGRAVPRPSVSSGPPLTTQRGDTHHADTNALRGHTPSAPDVPAGARPTPRRLVLLCPWTRRIPHAPASHCRHTPGAVPAHAWEGARLRPEC